MGDMLSQEEINALLGEAFTGSDDNTAANTDSSPAGNLDDALSLEEKDILGEIGNISMGTSATTLFALLGHRVSITTPRVLIFTWEQLAQSYDRPCVGIRVDYKEGLKGSNILILKRHDVKVISNLMMGGDGDVGDDENLSEIDMSAIGEAMNQMVGSSATSISSLVKQKIDIDTPHPFELNFPDDESLRDIEFKKDDILACITFRMTIGTLIDSEIMQVLPVQFAKEIVSKLMDDMMKEQEKTSLPKLAAEIEVPKMEVQQPQPAPVQAPPQQPQMMYEQPPVVPQQQYQQPPYPQQQYQQPQPMYQQPAYQPYPQQPMYPPPQNVNVQPVQFQNFDISSVAQQKENIEIIMDVPLEVSVELGRTHKKIKDILEFTPGTIIELDKVAGEPIDILVNGKFVAKGEVVVIDENFGIRITDIISVEQRI